MWLYDDNCRIITYTLFYSISLFVSTVRISKLILIHNEIHIFNWRRKRNKELIYLITLPVVVGIILLFRDFLSSWMSSLPVNYIHMWHHQWWRRCHTVKWKQRDQTHSSWWEYCFLSTYVILLKIENLNQQMISFDFFWYFNLIFVKILEKNIYFFSALIISPT